MGNPLSNRAERMAIAEISKLSRGSKVWIGHHIRNALTPLILTCGCDLTEKERKDLLDYCLDHVVKDLEKIGC